MEHRTWGALSSLPPDINEQLIAHARQALLCAAVETMRANHYYLSGEHLLLGLLCVRESTAALVLLSLGVSLRNVRHGVEAQIGYSSSLDGGAPELAPRAQLLLEQARDEARSRGSGVIGTEDLLLAVARETTSIAARALHDAGATTEKVRGDIERLHSRRYLRTRPHAGLLSPFAHLTEPAQRVLSRAHETARQLKHGYASGDHLLLSLLHEDTDVVPRALTELGIDVPHLRGVLACVLGSGVGEDTLHTVGTARLMRILELAGSEAQRLGHHDVAPGHLLLGVVREGESLAATILENLGVTLQRACDVVGRMGRRQTPEVTHD